MQPPAGSNEQADPIYEVFYGLTEQPFAISTDPRFFYLSASHQQAYQELLTGVQRNEGLLLLTGEAGTGKTTLCRAVIAALGDRTFSAILLNPYMSGAELLKLVLRDFGLVTREELRRGALARAEPPQLLDAIEGFLLSVRSLESRAIIVVDEAQSLSPAVLDQIRLLTALERHGRALVQTIIGGQPKLLETIRKDSLYALSERITRRVHLAPLLADEVPAYIGHRLSVAGGADAVTFLPEAVKVIADLSRGLPRRVNLLCDRALQVGRAEQAREIDTDMVRRAARSLSGQSAAALDLPRDSIADGVVERRPPPPLRPTAPGPADAARPPNSDAAGQPPVEPQPTGDAGTDLWLGRPEAPSATTGDAARTPLGIFGGAAAPKPRRHWAVLAAAIVVALSAVGYALVAQAAIEADTGIPPRPAAPARPVGPAPDIATPSEEEVLKLLEDLRQIHGSGGGELPDNRDQLD